MDKLNMIYFNNAAESYPKSLAIQEVVNGLPYYENGRNCNCSSNLNPSEEFRFKLSKFLNLPEDYQVTITNSATESANLILRSLPKSSCVVYDNFSHNCIVRTCNDMGFHSALMHNQMANVYCLTYQSNVDGRIYCDFDNFLKTCNDDSIIVIDISQAIGNVKLDISKWNHKNLYIFGTMHKYMGSICGCGFVCHPKNNFLRPLITGGTGTQTIDKTQPKNYPNYLESGTKNSLSIACACKSIDLMDGLFDTNNQAKIELTKYFLNCFNEKIDKDLFEKFFFLSHHEITNFAPYVNLVPYNSIVGKLVTSQLSNDHNIITRFGCHCVPYFTFEKNGKTYNENIRLSFNEFNVRGEVDIFIDALNDILLKNYIEFIKHVK